MARIPKNDGDHSGPTSLVWYLEGEVTAFSFIFSTSSFLEGNWARISSDDENGVTGSRGGETRSDEQMNRTRRHRPVMLNWVAFSSCRRWSSSLSPPPSSEEEKAGGGSVVRGERGLHTVLQGFQERPKVTRIREHLITDAAGFIARPLRVDS